MSYISPSIQLGGAGKLIGRKESVLAYSVNPTTGKIIPVPFNFSRNSGGTYQDQNGFYKKEYETDYPRFTWKDGNECLMIQPTSTNLVEYPTKLAFDDWWEVSGASIKATDEVIQTVMEDDASADGTADWTTTDCTLTYNVGDYYEVGYVAATQYIIWDPIMTLSPAKTYRISVDVRDGTSTGVTGRIFVHTGLTSSNGVGKSFTTTSSWETVTLDINTEDSSWQTFGVYSALTSGNYLIRNLKVEEVECFSSPSLNEANETIKSAFKLEEDASTGTHEISDTAKISITLNSTVTVTFWAKPAERTGIRFIEDRYAGSTRAVKFLLEGEGSTTNEGASVLSHSCNLESTGWYKCEVTISTESSLAFGYCLRLLNEGTNDSYAGTSGKGIYIWNLNLEESSFSSAPFSILPWEEGSAQTRAAEVLETPNLSTDGYIDFSTGASLFLKYYSTFTTGIASRPVLRDIGGGDTLGFSTNDVNWLFSRSNATSFSHTAIEPKTQDDLLKGLIALDSTDARVYADGSLQLTSTTNNPPSGDLILMDLTNSEENLLIHELSIFSGKVGETQANELTT